MFVLEYLSNRLCYRCKQIAFRARDNYKYCAVCACSSRTFQNFSNYHSLAWNFNSLMKITKISFLTKYFGSIFSTQKRVSISAMKVLKRRLEEIGLIPKINGLINICVKACKDGWSHFMV